MFSAIITMSTSDAYMSVNWAILGDDVITLERFLHYWPFVMGIHRWLLDSNDQRWITLTKVQ